LINSVDEIVKDKDNLLINIWKKGVPNWVRKTIWPILIGNKLEITMELYSKLKGEIISR
jgi:cytohesin/brefeldin A-inhibited guanine nucleotide-exchange protein